MNKSINQIKKELAFIKDNQKAINTYTELEAQYNKRLDWLKSQKQSQSIQRDITRIKAILDKLKTKINIEKLQRLEEFYIEITNSLEDYYDRMAIYKFYNQNKTLYRVAEELNYSVDGVRYRLRVALKKIQLKIKQRVDV